MRSRTPRTTASVGLLAASVALCCASCSFTVQTSAVHEVPREPVLESSNEVDVNTFNARVETASAVGDPWVRNPILVVMEFLHHPNASRVDISRTDPPGESTSRTTITVVQDGFLDDSVRGVWHEFVLDRFIDGGWRIRTARSAYRCCRGHQTDSYGARLCP